MAKKEEAALPAVIQQYASLQTIYPDLPDNYKESLTRLAKKSNPRKKGLSDEVGSASWNPPALRVMQPTTRNTGGADGVNPGDMFTSLGKRVGDSLNLIVLYRFTTHTRWDAGEFSGAPNCSSPGQLPGHNRLNVYGDECDTCPDLPFRDGQRTNCNKNMVYWVMDADSMEDIYSVQFSKSSYKIGSKLYRLARGQESAWSRAYKLTTDKKTTTRGVFYTYDVTMGDATDDHQQAIADGFYDLIHEQRTEMLQRLVDRAAAKADDVPEEGASSDGSASDEGGDVDFSM